MNRELPLEAIVAIAVAASVLVLVVKGMISGINPVASLLMFPFFICFVSVVSYLFGDQFYLWSKYQMRFIPYERDEHPTRALLMFLFLLAASFAFVGLLYALGPRMPG